jgi:2-polyprenyl-3-methyl-5-hydroxy-6-metoxy-1,4-benzoquinol methylase
MNWALVRHVPWLDTRAQFVAAAPKAGTLLDLGSSDGETLRHMAELRPDLHLFAADKAGQPEKYPAGCQFRRADLERDRLPWTDGSMDAITCMHLIEHLDGVFSLLTEAARLLKPGGRIYFETPHPRTLSLPSLKGTAAATFTMNFFDDPTHVRLVTIDALTEQVRKAGLEVTASGTSRNWLFAASWPLFIFLPTSRKKFTAHVHWLGWSAFLIACRPR